MQQPVKRPEDIAFPSRPRGWLWWRNAGFSKLRDFWDRGLYSGQAQALIDDANSVGGRQVGLAEFSNGNFLGEDAQYREFFTSSDMHFFPYPSLLSSTTFRQVRTDIRASVRPLSFPDGTLVKRVYLAKIGDGVSLDKHSALTHLGLMYRKLDGRVIDAVRTTIDDPSVLDEYHLHLIPKGIEYSGGILDYFFRGRLNVSLDTGAPAGKYRFRVTNLSGQAFKDGEFELYREVDGVRTEVSITSSYSGLLEDNAFTTVDFSIAGNIATRYVLVYRGTIGVNNGTPLDPVDAEIAIAAKSIFLIPWTFTDEGFIAGGQNGALRSYANPSDVTAPPWLMGFGQSLDEVSLRMSFENDHNCVGYNNRTQNGTAVGRVNPFEVFDGPVRVHIDWSGVGETRDADHYERMELRVDGALVGMAVAPGGGLECGPMAPVVSEPPPPQTRDLLEDREYEIQINTTTGDPLYHAGAYYQFNLRFERLPTTP